MVVLYGPPADPAAFRAYYERTHLPLVSAIPGLRQSQYGIGVEALGPASPYFCLWQGDFDSAAAMAAAMASPQGQAVGADVANYATGGATILHFDVQDGALARA